MMYSISRDRFTGDGGVSESVHVQAPTLDEAMAMYAAAKRIDAEDISDEAIRLAMRKYRHYPQTLD
jgi:hypothetical protein